MNSTSSLNTRAIAEGAIMAVITAMLALAGLYIPFMQFAVFFIWTVPTILVIVRHSITTGLVSLVVAGLLIFMLAGPLSAVIAVVQISGLALIYGYAFRKRWKAGITLVSGTAAIIASTLLLYYIVFLVTGINNLDLAGQLKEAMEPAIEMYKSLGIVGTEKGMSEAEIREILEVNFNLLGYLFPALFAFAGMSSAVLNFVVVQKILFRFKIDIPKLPPFRYWHLPWWVVWGFIAGFGAALAGRYWGYDILSKIGGNIMLLYTPVFFILGLAVIVYLLNKYLGGDKIYRVLLFAAIFFLMPYSAMLICVIGLFDLLFNYRRLTWEN